MDHCKNKQFIAFINKNSRDRYWCDGYFAWDEYAPTLHPYDTKEQRKTAIEIGEAIAAFSETNEIEAVILTVGTEIIPIVNKENKPAALDRFEKRSVDSIKKQEELKKKLLEEKKNKKSDETEVSNEMGLDAPISDSKVLDAGNSEQRTNITSKPTAKKTETKLNENNAKVDVTAPQGSSRKGIRSTTSKDNKDDVVKNPPTKPTTEIPQVKEIKRSPLEKRIPKQEMDKKVTTAPSEPKKKSGLSKIMKGEKK
jgi:hypothetical protein